MKVAFALAGIASLLVFVVQRCRFLAPYPAGAAMYYANVLAETGVRKLRVRRRELDIGLGAFAAGCLALGGTPPAGIALLAAIALAIEAESIRAELDAVSLGHVLTGPAEGPSGPLPGPTYHPDLVTNISGPLVSRSPRYSLGTLAVGRRIDLTVVVGNHSPVPTQLPVELSCEAPPCLERQGEALLSRARLEPGDVWELRLSFRAKGEAPSGVIRIGVRCGPSREELEVGFESCRPASGLGARSAAVSRYPGGRRSAFAWRGDMDLYDETTFQSVEGLERTLALGARYRVPQTMFLSTRLSLDEAEAGSWARHYGIDRGAARIPAFAAWVREQVDLRHSAPYPTKAGRRFVLELGNHGHLHYGTDTSGSEHNGWKRKARFGAGPYPWVTPGATSFEEQRDNGIEARRLCEDRLGFSPRSWALPDRTNDASTAAALEAAGCEVLSGSDVTAWHNVVVQPPPHHPPGTKSVELSVRHPGDPLTLSHVEMFRFWLHRGHRLGIPVVFMGHQHLHQGRGSACLALTERILRLVLTGFRGDFHVDTVFGVGKYWREVLSGETRSVTVSVTGGDVVVRNCGDLDLKDLPVDVEAEGPARFCVLCDVRAGEFLRLSGKDGAWETVERGALPKESS